MTAVDSCEKFSLAQIHDMIITHNFRMLLEQWNSQYQLEKGIINIIKNYAHYEKELMFINNNYYVNFGKEFPSITKEYLPEFIHPKNGMVSLQESQSVRFFYKSQFL